MRRYISFLFSGFLSTKREAWIQLFLALTAIGLLNYIVYVSVFLRFDMTEDNRYSISLPSKEIAKLIDDPITVTVYFSRGVNPQFTVFEEEVQAFLDEFRVYSNFNVEYIFVNPNESEELEIEAREQGIQPKLHNDRERDQIQQKTRLLWGYIFL